MGVRSVEEALPTPRRTIKSEIETNDLKVDDRNVVQSNDEEFIPATESSFLQKVYDDTNIIKAIEEANEQVEDTTELGPAIRYTSRGRKALFYEIPEKLTNTHSNEDKYDNSPVPQPQLSEDQYLSQVNARQPPFTGNNQANSNRGIARRLALSARLRNQAAYSRVS